MSIKLKEMTEDYRNYQDQLESIKDNNESNTFLTSNNISHHEINTNPINNLNSSNITKQYKHINDNLS